MLQVNELKNTHSSRKRYRQNSVEITSGIGLDNVTYIWFSLEGEVTWGPEVFLDIVAVRIYIGRALHHPS